MAISEQQKLSLVRARNIIISGPEIFSLGQSSGPEIIFPTTYFFSQRTKTVTLAFRSVTLFFIEPETSSLAS